MSYQSRRTFLKQGVGVAAAAVLAPLMARRGVARGLPLSGPMLLSATGSGPWGPYAASPFANKPCLSYSSLHGPDGKPMDIRWGTVRPEDFGPWEITFDQSEIRPLRPAPAPGVHPRLFFGPDDLPDVRARLKNTKCGQMMWNKIVSWSHALRGTYDESAPYAQPDLWHGSNRGSHGCIHLWYYHDATSPFNPANHLFDRLAAGDTTADPTAFWPVFAYDAFRCLIEEDAAGGKQLAAAVMTAMRHDQQVRDATRASKGETGPLTAPVSGGAGGQQLGFIYDLLFPFMTADQRSAVHDELAAGTWYHDNYGTFNAAVNTRSNWATFSYWLHPLLAIEGEPGFNDLKAAGMYRGWRNMLTYGWFPSGATVEGESKDQLGMDGVIEFARRGLPNLAGHPHLRSYAKVFLPHSILPNSEYIEAGSKMSQGPFIRYDLLGGFGSPNPLDVFGLKFLFPNDKVIDWVYRCAVGSNYERLPTESASGYFDALLFAAIFPSDFDATNNDPGKLGLEMSYFAGDRGLMMTRSGWDSDALMLNMHTRGASGGHPYCDRNSLALAGAGRIWFTINQWSGDSDQQGVVLINKQAQTATTPGRVVDYEDKPLATFIVGDAKYCWDWNARAIESPQGYTLADVQNGAIKMPPGGEPVMNSMNDFSLVKHDLEYMNAPLWELHDWIQPDGCYSPMVRTPNYPVQKAFRTAGLVRGKRPYALVVDDIQKDDSVHHYDWNALMQPDLGVAAQTAGVDGGIVNITFVSVPLPADAKTPPPAPTPLAQVKTGEPLLLVRLLDCQFADARADHAPTLTDITSRNNHYNLLTLPSDSVAPDYKVLIYAYRQGDPLPKTTWNHDHTELTVLFPEATDTVTFSRAASGKTDVTITRNEAGATTPLITVDTPITPLPDRAA